MKSLFDQFEKDNSLYDGLEQVDPDKFDGVLTVLALAINEARTYQNGTAGDVLANLKWQRGQLDILISNLEKLTP